MFHSAAVGHKFRVITVFRSSTLVRALALPQRYWEQTWLRCNYICTCWGKRDLNHQRRLWYQVA